MCVLSKSLNIPNLFTLFRYADFLGEMKTRVKHKGTCHVTNNGVALDNIQLYQVLFMYHIRYKI